MLRIQPRKGRQKRRVNIQDRARKLANERRAQQPHKARETNQIDAVLGKFRQHHAIVNFAIESLRRQADGIQSAFASDLQPARIGPIRNHHRDLGIDRSGGHVVRDRLEIRAASGDQNTETLHR
jgi:hypothetical protein